MHFSRLECSPLFETRNVRMAGRACGEFVLPARPPIGQNPRKEGALGEAASLLVDSRYNETPAEA
jgi:hypothetical protein